MKATRYTPDQYADLLISELGAEFFKKNDEFLNLGSHRDLIANHFREALGAAFNDGKFVGKHEWIKKERERMN